MTRTPREPQGSRARARGGSGGSQNARPGQIDGETWSGLQITAAAGVVAIVDRVAKGQLPARGLLRMENVDCEASLQNRCGSHYA